MSTETRIKKAAMVKAMEEALGIVSAAARKVGIDRSTHYQWLKDDETYRAAIDSIQDIALDFAESQLHKQIQNGEVSSTIFYLKTKGKKRGYIERQEFQHEGQVSLPVIFQLDERFKEDKHNPGIPT
jgi:hypothetical protein